MNNGTDLNETRLFVAVVQLGSFTKAATHLDIPKSTVSKKVTDLERRLGVQLLRRTTRRLDLTSAGELYFARASKLVDGLLNLDHQLEGLSDSPSGNIRVTVPPGFLSYAQPRVTEFLDTHRDIRLEMVESGELVDLESEGFDFAVRAGVAEYNNLNSVLLTRGEVWLMASPAYLEKNPVTLDNLSEHDGVVLFMRRERPWKMTHGARTVEFMPNIRVAVSTVRSVTTCCATGLGLTLLPRLVCRPELKQGKIIRALEGWKGDDALLHAVYPKSAWLTAAARSFLEFLKEGLD